MDIMKTNENTTTVICEVSADQTLPVIRDAQGKIIGFRAKDGGELVPQLCFLHTSESGTETFLYTDKHLAEHGLAVFAYSDDCSVVVKDGGSHPEDKG